MTGQHAGLIGIEVRSVPGEAMLGLDIQQRKLVRQRCGTPRALQQTAYLRSRILVGQIADGP